MNIKPEHSIAKIVFYSWVFLLCGCSSNMAEAPSENEITGFTTPYSFMEDRLSPRLFGIKIQDEELIVPDNLPKIEADFILFKSYVTDMNNSHLKKPVIDAKSYCEYNGGDFQFLEKTPVQVLNKLRLHNQLVVPIWQAGYLGDYACTGNDQDWYITVNRMALN